MAPTIVAEVPCACSAMVPWALFAVVPFAEFQNILSFASQKTFLPEGNSIAPSSEILGLDVIQISGHCNLFLENCNGPEENWGVRTLKTADSLLFLKDRNSNKENLIFLLVFFF